MNNERLAIAPQTIMIECILTPNGGNTVALNPFKQQDQLIGRPIIGIEAFSAYDMPYSPLSSNLPVIPDSLFPYAFLNIQRAGVQPLISGQWFKNMPLCSLRHLIQFSGSLSGNLDKFMCDPMTIQWPDSNISFPKSQAQGAIYSVPLLITYLLGEQDPTPYNTTKIRARR